MFRYWVKTLRPYVKLFYACHLCLCSLELKENKRLSFCASTISFRHFTSWLTLMGSKIKFSYKDGTVVDVTAHLLLQLLTFSTNFLTISNEQDVETFMYTTIIRINNIRFNIFDQIHLNVWNSIQGCFIESIDYSQFLSESNHLLCVWHPQCEFWWKIFSRQRPSLKNQK